MSSRRKKSRPRANKHLHPANPAPAVNDRYGLIGGPYHPPLIPKSGLLRCEMRGRLPVGGYSQALIPWPMRRGKHSIILCGDLVRAVKQESVEAISHHWNVSRALVQVWRKTLQVPEFNAGTRHLREVVERLRKPFKRARDLQRWRDPDSRLPLVQPPRELRRPATSAAAKAQFARTGRHPNPDLRLWTAKEEKLLGTASDEVVGARLNRTALAVRARRNLLGIPSYQRCYIRVWTPEEDRLLGTKTDREIAALLHRPVGSALQRRLSLGVPNRHPAKRCWTKAEDQLLRRYPEQEVARRTRRTLSAVQQRRFALQLPLVNPKLRRWTSKELDLLGRKSDTAVARLTGRTRKAVGLKRFKMGIAPFAAPADPRTR